MLRFLIPFLLAVSLTACGGGGSASEPTAVPEPTPEPVTDPVIQALTRHVETTHQKQFVEDCAKADPQRDVGKICAVPRGERQGQRAYALGLTFSEGIEWVFLGQSGPAWNVVSVVPMTPDVRAVPGIPWPLRTGVDVVVVGAAPCLNVREGPGTGQRAVDCINDGTVIRLAAGPAPADNIQWWQVAGRSGWVSGDYLRYPDAAQ